MIKDLEAQKQYFVIAEIVKIMYQENIQKKVTVFYGGDMDPSGDSMDKVLEEHINLFADYDFGFEDKDFGYPYFDEEGNVIRRNLGMSK